MAGLIFALLLCARRRSAVGLAHLHCGPNDTLPARGLGASLERGGECAGRGDGPGGAHSRPPRPDRAPAYFGIGRPALLAALVLNPIALIAIGSVCARALEAIDGTHPPQVISDGPGACRSAADYAPLARLPRGRVAAFIDAEPFLLMETPHSVLAAPYHRNVEGNIAMLDIFLARPDETKAPIAALGVDYIAFCRGAPERYNYAAAAPEGSPPR